MIKLGYLEGYNKFNEISFNNLSSQKSYFDNLVEHTIDAYYPPYYTNVIKVDISEVPQTTPINFAILVYNNKYYYYFIDSIDYINEDIYNIRISMDTIQTYAFNFTVKKGVLTRETIKRWTAGAIINRDYIPENISEGEFINDRYVKPFNNYFFEVISTTDYPVPQEQAQTYIKEFYPSRMYPEPDNNTGIAFAYTYLYYFPLNTLVDNGYVKITIKHNGVLHREKQYSTLQYMAFYQEHYNRDSTKNIRLISCSYMNFISITEEKEGNVVHITFDIDTSYCYIDLGEVFYDTQSVLAPILFVLSQTTKLMNIDYSATVMGYNFQKNTQLGQSFNIQYIPQMLDENYMNIVYGEKTKSSQVPLRMYNTPNLKFKSYFDLQSGSRSYGCYDTTDNYNTIVTALYGNEFTLFSSYWLNYEATHKSSLTDGYVLAQTNNALNFAKGALGSYTNTTYNTASIISGEMHSMETQYGYYKDMNSSYSNNRNVLQNITGYSKIGAINNAISAGQNMYNTYKNREILKADLKASPDDMGNVVEVMTSYATNSIENIFAIYRVRDIDTCARYFEYNGYKVHKVINGNYRYNEIAVNRYYYNVIQLQDVEISITSFIPFDILGDIKARLSSGIRVFRNDVNSILDILQYDNVEIDEIGGN